MNEHFILELIGYIGSAFVLISFLMATVIKLRIINSIGSLISVAYGFFIHAYPTVVMNACLLIINIVYLVKLFRHKESFHIVPVNISDSSVQFFINLYTDDIQAFFPDFQASSTSCDFLRLIYCQNKMVGLFAANQTSAQTLDIQLDYTTKEFRDYSVGYYLFDALGKQGIKTLSFNKESRNHAKYLQKMGFSKTEQGFSISL